MPWATAATLQEQRRAAVLSGTAHEWLALCEHDPVITLGRGARPEHVLLDRDELARRGITLARASRGGDVTYHGPGQLVGYPVFRVQRGIVAHVEAMASAVVTLLQDLGIVSEWRRDRPGVWVGREKICAFGVHVAHRVAIHGFALNVTIPLESFAAIVPCGLPDAGVTSIARLLGRAPPLTAVAVAAADALARAFARPLVRRPAPDCQGAASIDTMRAT